MRKLLIALQFLTIIPLRKSLEVTEEDLGKSMVYFPLIGLFIGGCLALSQVLLSFLFPPVIVDGLLVTIAVLLTGALHLDGLSDTIDALASRKGREEKLRIMKEGKIGAVGAVGVFLVLMLKYASLTALPKNLTLAALLLFPAMGRWAQLVVAYFSEYAGQKKGLGFPFTLQVTYLMVIVTTVPVFLLSFLLFKIKGVVMAGVIGLFCVLYSHFFKRALGGVTGDVLGAVNELTEVLFLLLVLVKF